MILEKAMATKVPQAESEGPLPMIMGSPASRDEWSLAAAIQSATRYDTAVEWPFIGSRWPWVLFFDENGNRFSIDVAYTLLPHTWAAAQQLNEEYWKSK